MKHIAKVYPTDFEASLEKMLDSVLFQNLELEVTDNIEKYPHNHLIVGNCVISYLSQEKPEEIQGASFDAIMYNEITDESFKNEVLATSVLK